MESCTNESGHVFKKDLSCKIFFTLQQIVEESIFSRMKTLSGFLHGASGSSLGLKCIEFSQMRVGFRMTLSRTTRPPSWTKLGTYYELCRNHSGM